MSCLTCGAFVPIEDSRGTINRGECHRRAPEPILVVAGSNVAYMSVFPPINLPNFCMDKVPLSAPPPPLPQLAQ